METQNKRKPPIVLPLIFLFVLALSIRLGIAWGAGFDGLYGQDAYYYFEEGRQFAFHFKYTGLDSIGYPALLAWVTLLFGMRPEIAQTVGLLLGALTPVLVCLLGWMLTRRYAVAVISGLLMCLIPWHIRGSIVMMSDVPALFWLTGGVAGGVRYVQRPSWPWVLAVAGFMGAAVATRYVSALVVIPIAAYAMASGRRPPWSHLIAGAVLGVAVFLPELFHARWHIPSLFLLEGWRPFNALRSRFVTPDGTLSYAWPVAVMYAKALAGWGFLNPVWAVCGLAGVREIRNDRPAAGLLLAWIAGLYGFLIGLPLVNPRYLLPMAIPLSLLSAMGLVALWETWGRKTCKTRLMTIVLVVLGLLGSGVGAYRTVGEVLARKQCERRVVEWIDKNIPEDSLIIAFDVAHAAQYYTFHRVVHLHEIDPTRLRVPPGDRPGVYLIWNEAHAARVARRRPRPGDLMPRFSANYAWLRDRVRRTRLARVCQWEIMRVNAR